ncbi:hypothetical protein TNCT_454431 [Trichonephila clavata]|uniref:Uncharacterized protein n=1 Tax=Trichonephila clavata TaxID=2740835 RepID=A0A8X6IBW6_TRICU|nr:hypothetical protein TNCT_454431 [Trichonephila clavata]
MTSPSGSLAEVHKYTIQYSTIPFAVRSVTQNESFSIFVTPKTYTLYTGTGLKDSESRLEPSKSTDDDEEYPAD